MTQYKTIADLPAASAINPQDLFELSQFGTSRSVSLNLLTAAGAIVPEAPLDGQQYARQSAAWTVVAGATAWTDITGKPATFPPTLPIGESDVTGLVSDLAAKAPLASPVFTGDPTRVTAPALHDSDSSIPTTAWVQTEITSALAGASITIPAGSIAFGGVGGVVTGNSTLAWNDTGKNFAITGWTGAAAAFSIAGSVPASPAVDAFVMSVANPSNNSGNIFRLRAGAAGTTDRFKVDMFGDAACSGSVQAFALSAPPAGGGGAFGLFLGNFSGGNSGVYFGSGAPTLSTFGRYGSLYINTASPGVPSYNSNGGTGWTLLAPITAVGTSPPAAPVDGQLWFNSDASTGGGVLYISYNDGNTTQWIAVSPPTSGPPVSLLEARVAELEARLAALEASP